MEMRTREFQYLSWEDVSNDSYVTIELTPFVEKHTANIEFVRVSSKSMICVLTLKNGFDVRGESGVIDPSKFNARIGAKYALHTAVDKASTVIAYAEQQKLFDGKPFERDQPAPFPA